MQARSTALRSGRQGAQCSLTWWETNPHHYFGLLSCCSKCSQERQCSKGMRMGSAILSHIKDRNPLNYDHANLHPAKTANYMSGGHSVIRNNCHYTFIYSFYASLLNYHGYNLKTDSAKPPFDHTTPSWICELIMAVWSQSHLKREMMDMQSGEPAYWAF